MEGKKKGGTDEWWCKVMKGRERERERRRRRENVVLNRKWKVCVSGCLLGYWLAREESVGLCVQLSRIEMSGRTKNFGTRKYRNLGFSIFQKIETFDFFDKK